jgi:hypothetical protein
VATQLNDMSLGGSGFAAGYTPIRFAPLVSLTGPIQGATPPTAAAPEAPMARPPMLPTMADMPDNAYMTGQAGAYPDGMQPFGARTSEQKMGDLMNLGGFFMSPIGSMLNYAMTGQTPAQSMRAMFGGAQEQQGQGQAPSGAQGGGVGIQNPVPGLAGWFGRNVFGPEQYPLNARQAPVETAIPSMVFDGGMYSVTPELSPIGQTNAIFNDPAFYNAIAAGVPMEQIAAAIGISPAVMAQMVSGAADIFGNPISADAVAVNPINGGGQIGVSPDFVEQSSAADNYGVMGFSGGGQSPSEFSFDDASSGAYGYF